VAAIRELIEGIEFSIDFHLEDPIDQWSKDGDRYHTGPYVLEVERTPLEPGGTALRWRLRRTDEAPVVLRNLAVDYQMPLVSLYRVWPTSGIAANSVFIDLPWTIDAVSSAAAYDPLLMGLNADGTNACTVGFVDTALETRITGKMGRRSPDAEAGFTSHVYSARLERPCGSDVVQRGDELRDGVFVSRIHEDWFASLRRYTALVDAERGFEGREVQERGLSPMWHSWYAFENEINQDNVLSQIETARELGFGTFQLDAGWNTGADWVVEEGCYRPNRERFPEFERVMEAIKAAGLVPVAHWSPPWVGAQAPNREELAPAIQGTTELRAGQVDYLCPRTPATLEHIVSSARHMVADLGFGGLWYDFIDSLPSDLSCTSDHEHQFDTVGEAWDAILEATAETVWEIDPECLLIFRRSHANINNKPYLTHLWPADAPFDYDKNRREVIVMRAYGKGVLTHACCTCWSPDEAEEMVARHLASVVLAGVPAVSIDLTRFPDNHLEGIKRWLAFYESHKRALMLGELRPLVFMPPSAVTRTEAEDTAFVGYFEGLPGVTPLSSNFDDVYLVNCFAEQVHTLLPSQQGRFSVQVFDHFLRPLDRDQQVLEADDDGLHLSLATPVPSVIHLRRID
jgi:hypothetical protein